MTSAHALTRIAERFPDVANLATRVAAAEAAHPLGSVAVRLAWNLPHRGPAYDGDNTPANGDEVWAVIRDGTTATVFPRRREQSRYPASLGVDRVYLRPTTPA